MNKVTDGESEKTVSAGAAAEAAPKPSPSAAVLGAKTTIPQLLAGPAFYLAVCFACLLSTLAVLH